METLALDLPRLCGQLIIGGFDGPALPDRYVRALREGHRGGAILFRRNLPDVSTAAGLCAAITAASHEDLPPFIGVDQEGGRVTRLPAPFLTLPPMRALGDLDDPSLVRRAGQAVGAELAALGFNLNFAPVLDVDSNPDNPVIGDRSFGRDPRVVAENATAFLEGMQSQGVLGCGKHFPGHGDTSVDSHVDLPILAHGRARFDQIELPPFRAAAAAGLATLMTAHVVCTALDPAMPATLSHLICTRLLRDEIGFSGVLFSDDLEMGAVAARYPIEETAVQAVRAGCDALLICKSEEAQHRAHDALVRAAEADAHFRERCAEAAGRSLAARRKAPPRPLVDSAALEGLVGGAEGKAVLEAIAARQRERAAQANEAR